MVSSALDVTGYFHCRNIVFVQSASFAILTVVRYVFLEPENLSLRSSKTETSKFRFGSLPSYDSTKIFPLTCSSRRRRASSSRSLIGSRCMTGISAARRACSSTSDDDTGSTSLISSYSQ